MNALPALLLCALAGCGTSDKVELRFAPAEGSRVRRTIEVDHLVLRTLDQYLKVGDGRPLLLRRQFEEIRMDDQQVSQLSGTSVVFTWVPEEGTYGKYYDARESSESTLRDLPEDLDLRALLPASPVAVGDSWSMPVSWPFGVRAAGTSGQEASTPCPATSNGDMSSCSR